MTSTGRRWVGSYSEEDPRRSPQRYLFIPPTVPFCFPGLVSFPGLHRPYGGCSEDLTLIDSFVLTTEPVSSKSTTDRERDPFTRSLWKSWCTCFGTVPNPRGLFRHESVSVSCPSVVLVLPDRREGTDRRPQDGGRRRGPVFGLFDETSVERPQSLAWTVYTTKPSLESRLTFEGSDEGHLSD